MNFVQLGTSSRTLTDKGNLGKPSLPVVTYPSLPSASSAVPEILPNNARAAFDFDIPSPSKYLVRSTRSLSTIDIYTAGPSQIRRISINNATPFTPGYVKENVVRVSDPSQSYCNRVKGRQILLDNPEREGRARKERIAKRNERTPSRALVGVIGKPEAKQKGLWKLSAAEIKFDRFLPLHYLWMDYMSELLNLSPPPSVPGSPLDDRLLSATSSLHAKLVKADLHGSILSVRQSRNPCLVGLSGIVVHETENAFKIVTKNNHLKLVPKSHSIFVLSLPLFSYIASRHGVEPACSTVAIDSQDITPSTSAKTRKNVPELPHVELELYGNQFCFRASDRASKKFKSKETIEL